MNCQKCNAPIESGRQVTITEYQGTEKSLVTICSKCESELEQRYDEETRNPNLFGAIFIGIIAAALGALLPYALYVWTNMYSSAVIILVALIAGGGVILGSGNKRGVVLQVISVLICLISLAFSEYLIARHTIIQAAANHNLNPPLFIPINLMIQLVVRSVTNDFFTILCWLAGLTIAFIMPKRQKLNRV
jgi:hypothetical protein